MHGKRCGGGARSSQALCRHRCPQIPCHQPRSNQSLGLQVSMELRHRGGASCCERVSQSSPWPSGIVPARQDHHGGQRRGRATRTPFGPQKLSRPPSPVGIPPGGPLRPAGPVIVSVPEAGAASAVPGASFQAPVVTELGDCAVCAQSPFAQSAPSAPSLNAHPRPSCSGRDSPCTVPG